MTGYKVKGQQKSGKSWNSTNRLFLVLLTTVNFVRKGHAEAGKGGNKICSTWTDDVVYYAEYCKQTKPSIYGSEIQRKMVENNVCLAQNVLSHSASYKNSFGPMIPNIKIWTWLQVWDFCDNSIAVYFSYKAKCNNHLALLSLNFSLRCSKLVMS